ncbi:hypothetical protein [Insolitispirillum peregrinum]|uniref:hypothetical protein n=1 Tax=Insolitispirillum peregrinum TaxID=80876 RepID=UPI003622F1A0
MRMLIDLEIDAALAVELEGFIRKIENSPPPPLTGPLSLRWQSRPIERKIKPLVDALNQSGFKSYASCAGHLTGPRSPYVAFTGPLEVAARLDGGLVQGLRLHWEMTMGFNYRNELVFGIYLGAGSKPTSMMGSLWRYVFTRHLIDRDIRDMARRVQRHACISAITL